MFNLTTALLVAELMATASHVTAKATQRFWQTASSTVLRAFGEMKERGASTKLVVQNETGKRAVIGVAMRTHHRTRRTAHTHTHTCLPQVPVCPTLPHTASFPQLLQPLAALTTDAFFTGALRLTRHEPDSCPNRAAAHTPSSTNFFFPAGPSN